MTSSSSNSNSTVPTEAKPQEETYLTLFAGAARGFAASIRTLAPTVTRTIAGARPLAFASEVGVASKPIIPSGVYYGAWGLSGLAVICDGGHKVFDAPPELRMKTAIYQTAFHVPASLVVPAVIIHQVVHFSQDALEKRPKLAASLPPRLKPVVPVIAALMSIPVVVPVVDHGTEYILDKTLVPALGLPQHDANHEKKH